jgi:hypothetical protein
MFLKCHHLLHAFTITKMGFLVEVKFNPCRIISHYYNNRFALQYAHIHNFYPNSKHIWLCSSLKHQIHGYFI